MYKLPMGVALERSAGGDPGGYARPPRLRVRDRVRVVAPCGPFARERFEAGIAWLHEIGLEPSFDDGVFSRTGYLAGDDDRRLAELEAAIADTDARALWVARGGYGAMRLLERLDPAPVAASPRWLVGFSDVTALHALWQRAGLASVHGANVTTLGSWSPRAREALRGLLFDGAGITLAGRTVAGAGVAAGPLVGGNLAMLAALAGTGWLPASKGAIVLLEEVREPPYRIDRLLTQLTLAGAFEGVAGFAVGHLTGCEPAAGHEDGPRAEEVIAERLARLGVPVVVDLPLGHGDDAMPTTLGTLARIDAARGTLEAGGP